MADDEKTIFLQLYLRNGGHEYVTVTYLRPCAGVRAVIRRGREGERLQRYLIMTLSRLTVPAMLFS